MVSVAIVGGGAAGLAAAVVAAECGCEVTVYEASDRVGRPVLATGNGRCNFSNARLDARRYWNASFAAEVLRALCAGVGTAGAAGACDLASVPVPDPSLGPVLGFFARHGLVWAEEAEGRLYPASRKATSVLDVLRFPAAEAGARFCCDTPIAAIEPPRAPGKPYTLRTRAGEFKRADAVIVAVGGAITRDILPADIAFSESRPVLGPLATNTETVRMLDNVRVRAAVRLLDAQGREKARETGEVLFRKYGVSGIAVFNLSRLAEPGDELRISLLPALEKTFAEYGCPVTSSEDGPVYEAERFLSARYRMLTASHSAASVEYALTPETFFRGMFAGIVAEALCKQAGIAYEEPLRQADIPVLACAIAAFPLTVKGPGDAKQCQVHRGGVDTAGIDPATCEAKGHPGLFVVGEALDVDGPCGGYNLHWAWSTGILAALHVGRR